MSDVHIGARVSRELAEALGEVASEARTSKSEVIREHLRSAVLEGEAEIPEHLRIQLRRQELKAKNSHTWQKVYFRSNVADRFRRAFEQGDLEGEMGEKAIEDIREMYVEDAETLFSDDDREQAAKEYVNALAEHAKEASDTSEFNPNDPEEMWSYGGVEDGRSREDFEQVVEDAHLRLRSGAQDEDALADALAKEHGVTEDLAREAVDAAQEGDPVA